MAWGKGAAALAAAVVACAGAAPAAHAGNPYHGTWVDPMSMTVPEQYAQLWQIAQSGAGTIRIPIFWDRIETAPGVFDWRRLDSIVHHAWWFGLDVLPHVNYAPAFYVTRPAGVPPSTQYPPDDPYRLSAFMHQLVRRYGPGGTFWCGDPPQPDACRAGARPIVAWQIWNEPDLPAWWKRAPSATEYAGLLWAAWLGVKFTDRSAQVVLGGLTKSAAAPGGYLQELYDAGAGPLFDVLALHTYAPDVAGVETTARRFRAIAAANGQPDKPLWITEYGWADASSAPTPYLAESRECAGALVHAATRRLAALGPELGLRGIVQFQWRDAPTQLGFWPDFAGLLDLAGAAKPALGAWVTAVRSQPPPAGLRVREACPASRWAGANDPPPAPDPSPGAPAPAGPGPAAAGAPGRDTTGASSPGSRCPSRSRARSCSCTRRATARRRASSSAASSRRRVCSRPATARWRPIRSSRCRVSRTSSRCWSCPSRRTRRQARSGRSPRRLGRC